MASAPALYSPTVLALATSLAAYPFTADLPLQGTARSATCGSTVKLGLGLDGEGRIAKVGLAAHACAIGQASAALFAQGASGRCERQIAATLAELRAWLSGEGAMPDWPRLEAISAARAYPARHGAILLSWRAALDALSTAPSGG